MIIQVKHLQRHLQKTPSSQIKINKPKEDFVISLLNGYIDVNVEGNEKTDKSRHVNGIDIRLVNLSEIYFFIQ